MLSSGKWLIVLSLLNFATCVCAEPFKGKAKHASKAVSTLDSKLLQEQEAAFSLSSNQKLMPEEQWFVDKAYGESSDSDPMSARWIKQNKKFK